MNFKIAIGLMIAMVMMGGISSMSVPAVINTGHDPMSIKDALGHFPGASSNTIYPGMLPPGYVYTRRVKTSMPNQLYYPTMPSYTYRRRTTYNNNWPWMWYAMNEM